MVAMFGHKASFKERTFRFFFLLILQNVRDEVRVWIKWATAFCEDF